MKTVRFLLSCSILLCGSLAASGAERAGGPPEDLPFFDTGDLRREIAVQELHEKELLAFPGVVGTGIGYRNGAPALVVLVDSKAASPHLPPVLDGVPVVLEKASAGEPVNGGDGCSPLDPTGAYVGCHAGLFSLPVPMGVTTAPTDPATCSYAAGTLGFKACEVATGTIGYVTNNHVAAIKTNGCPNGTFGAAQAHQAPWENRPACTYTWAIGTLVNHVALTFGATSTNTVDAAFVLSSDAHTSRSILDIGLPSAVPGTPLLNACVRKSGRTTGLTHGRIDLVNTTLQVSYCGNVAKFQQIFRIKADSTCGTCQDPTCFTFVKPGDSGSAVVDNSSLPKIVGLIFARDLNGNGYANRIDLVLSALGLDLDPSACQ